jgi:hypothetical protein
MSVEMSVTGIPDVMAKLEQLSVSMQKRLILAAGRAALKPVVADVRARVPVKTGTLKKSIGVKKAKRSPAGTIVLSVGARGGFSYVDEDGKRQNPFFYSIPIEYGHVLKNPRSGAVVGYVAPVGMFRAAYEKNRIQVVEDFGAELSRRIDEELP